MTKDQELEKAAEIFVAHYNNISLDDVGEFATDILMFEAGANWQKSRKPVGELVFDSRESAFQENCHGETSAARLADYCNNKIRKALSTETQGGGK